MPTLSNLLAGFALISCATQLHTAATAIKSTTIIEIHNANHIFNAIHSSMRQWGAAWYHNGMTFFLASVPAGTQFYHGTSSDARVNGTEWLAFEPEHALHFAHPRGKRPGPGPPPHSSSNSGPSPLFPSFGERSHQEVLHDSVEDGGNEGEGEEEEEEEEEKFGYLHTYSAAKDLRLLYLDGLSAGKTDMGTLDAQDRILLRDKLTGISQNLDNERKGPGGPPGEGARAILACQIAEDEWNGRIDGFLRTEAGFEIILCNFTRDLHLERIGAVSSSQSFSEAGNDDIYQYKSIAARFGGIGGGRVRVDYEHFVTAFAYAELDLFNHSSNSSSSNEEQQQNGAAPRLMHIPSEKLDPIRTDLTRLVLSHDALESSSSFNWQSIADMIVLKYSDFLKSLTSSKKISTLDALQTQIHKPFRPFIDPLQRNPTLEIERCATQFIPHHTKTTSSTPDTTTTTTTTNTDRQSLAHKAIHSVSHTICSTLHTILTNDTDFKTAISRVDDLIQYLAWTTWNECPEKCAYNEACFIPIWPEGTLQDRLSPQCRDRPNHEGERYWSGGPGGPKPPPAFPFHAGFAGLYGEL